MYLPKVLSGITIDSPSTRDIDDGIWVERTQDGWLLTVVVADVSAHIRQGSSLDQEALRRVASRYFANGNEPMLPRGLSENRMSLLPGKSRGVLAAKISITDHFQTKLESLTVERFKSNGRVDYPTIPEVITDKTLPEITTLGAIATGLLDVRRDKGALVVYDLIQGWVTTEEGYLKQMKDTRETIGYIMIQEAMILTNSLIAEWCVKENVPVLFRNHTARPATPALTEMNQQIRSALNGPWQELDNFRKRLHMLLDRADYGPTLKGHFGLSLPAYLHFTSPIRRYADLVNHRQIRAKLLGKALPYSQQDLEGIAAHINGHEAAQREKKAESLKSKANARAERSLERGQLSRLDDKEFERVLKVALRSGEDLPEALVGEFLDRFSVDKVPLICMTAVCFHTPEFPTPTEDNPKPGWRKLRDTILSKLQEKPELGIQLWELAKTYAKEEPVEFQDKRQGPDHAPVFAAMARSGLFTTGWSGARTAKLARQRAAVWLLFRYHGLPEKGWLVTDPEPPEAPPPPSKVSLREISSGKDPIMALMEYSQKLKLTPPEFIFDKQGPDHIPDITCKCSFNQRTGVGRATSKQEAKRQAAQDLIKQLL